MSEEITCCFVFFLINNLYNKKKAIRIKIIVSLKIMVIGKKVGTERGRGEAKRV